MSKRGVIEILSDIKEAISRIKKYVEDNLAEEILRGTFKDGTKIIAKHFENTEELVFLDEDASQDQSHEEREKSDSGEVK